MHLDILYKKKVLNYTEVDKNIHTLDEKLSIF